MGIPNNLMPYITQVASGRLKQLSVFGDDYDTPDGTGVRDYIHVVDLAKGHVAAVNYLADHHGCEIINLGTGVGYSVLDMVKAFEKANGIEIPYRHLLCRPVQGQGTAALDGGKDLGRHVPRQLALAEKQPQRLSGRLIGYGPPCLRVVGFGLAVSLCGVLDPRYCAPFSEHKKDGLQKRRLSFSYVTLCLFLWCGENPG